MTSHLPIRLAPLPGEALESFVQRTARANLLRPVDVGWPARLDHIRHRGSVDLGRISSTTGLSAEALQDMTVFTYPPAVTGTARPGALKTLWRISGQRRYCPGCSPHIRCRDWDLALSVCCLRCLQLLRPAAEARDYPPIPAGDALPDQQTEIDGFLGVLDRPEARARIRRLHRFVRLATMTADQAWPVTPSGYLTEARTALAWTLDWTESRTPADAVAVATLVSACWPATRTRTTQRAFLSAAWTRVDARNIELPSRSLKTLPGIPAEPAPRVRRRDASAEFVAVASELRHRGLGAANVPLLLMSTDETFLPPLHELGRRHALARQLFVAVRDIGPAAELPDTRDLRLGTTQSEQAVPGRGELGRYVDALLGDSPVDYAERRALLPGALKLVTTPQSWLTEPDKHRLATAWIWVHLTRGPLVCAVHRLRMLDLVQFDRWMDPEQRLQLHDSGMRQLEELWMLAIESQPARVGRAQTRDAS